jgi:hypothetical protein
VKEALPYLVIASAVLSAAIRAGLAPVKAESPSMNDRQARQVYFDVTAKEPDERRDAALRFAGSAWSEQDDFHARERGMVRAVANGRGVSVSNVVFALDRGMREGWPTGGGVAVSPKVIPCRPRLLY